MFRIIRVQGFVAAGDLLATRPALASQVALITPDALKRQSIREARMGLYRDNGKENGNYYLGFRVWG